MRVRQYLLDTNVLLAYIRAGKVGEYVEQTYKLRSLPFQPLICIVSVGEIKAIAASSRWSSAKSGKMDDILRRMITVDISEPGVIDAYVDVVNSRPKGYSIPQNDMWIAAAVVASKACLLTCDHHFDYLADSGKIERCWIDPCVGKPAPPADTHSANPQISPDPG